MRVRDYLLKGGFLWADDQWGTWAWESWVQQIGRILPPERYPLVDITPDHPVFKMMFEVRKLIQIPSLPAGEEDKDRRAGSLTGDGGQFGVVVRTPAGWAEEDCGDGRVLLDRVNFFLIPVRSSISVPEPWDQPAVSQRLIDTRDSGLVSVVENQMDIVRLDHQRPRA